MDPLSVLKVLWRYKWVALPVVLVAVFACSYVFKFAPRTYEASETFAVVAPKLPSASDLQLHPALEKVNMDNPYLRSPDSSLLTQVVMAKLTSPDVPEQLKSMGLGTDYTIQPLNSMTSGLVKLTASAESPEVAVETATWLGAGFTKTLHDVQKINGADDSYLFALIPIEGPGPATEVFSSRLRTMIMVGVGGLVALFGAVSIAHSVSMARQRKGPPPVAAARPEDNVGGRELHGVDARQHGPHEPAGLHGHDEKPVSGRQAEADVVDLTAPRKVAGRVSR